MKFWGKRCVAQASTQGGVGRGGRVCGVGDGSRRLSRQGLWTRAQVARV